MSSNENVLASIYGRTDRGARRGRPGTVVDQDCWDSGRRAPGPPDSAAVQLPRLL
jgi:hypothetical protein